MALFDRLMVFDAEGHPVADWPPFPAGGPEIGERPYFQHVKAFRRPWVSEPYRGGETGIDQVMVIQPLLGEQGEFLGILGANTSLRDGQAYLNLRGRRLGEAGHVLLATAEGQVISHPDESRLMRRLPEADTHLLIDQALLGWEGSGEGATLDGRPALAAFRQVWPASWVVGVFLPMEQVQAPIRRYARELRWVGIGSVALMLPLLWWLLGLGLRPLHRLERQIALVGQGKVQRQERERRQRWEAEHDALTRCLNRRGFARRLEAACELSRRRADHVLALVMLDLDHFKEVNDSAGHAVGDALLQRAAEALEEAVRDGDAVARLGGDEFALLLAGASSQVALRSEERVRERLAALDFAHGDRRFRTSASIGVAMFEGDDDDRTLMARADRASYQAKRGGRNRVVMARQAPADLPQG